MLAKKVLVALLLVFALLSLILLSTQNAAANVRQKSDGQVPFYARIERGEVFHTAEWAAIYFYRPPSCVPEAFNLLDFFDFNAFDCQPATTDGFNIWKNGPDVDMAPWKSKSFGRGAVPVWFVAWPELQDALSDDVLTIGELAAMASLKTGTADNFQEELHPVEAAKNAKINFVASGSLDDGGSFWVHGRASSASGKLMTQIAFGG